MYPVRAIVGWGCVEGHFEVGLVVELMRSMTWRAVALLSRWMNLIALRKIGVSGDGVGSEDAEGERGWVLVFLFLYALAGNFESVVRRRENGIAKGRFLG